MQFSHVEMCEAFRYVKLSRSSVYALTVPVSLLSLFSNNIVYNNKEPDTFTCRFQHSLVDFKNAQACQLSDMVAYIYFKVCYDIDCRLYIGMQKMEKQVE